MHFFLLQYQKDWLKYLETTEGKEMEMIAADGQVVKLADYKFVDGGDCCSFQLAADVYIPSHFLLSHLFG